MKYECVAADNYPKQCHVRAEFEKKETRATSILKPKAKKTPKNKTSTALSLSLSFNISFWFYYFWLPAMEAILTERIQNSLRYFMFKNAIFLCERLCAEFPSEVTHSLTKKSLFFFLSFFFFFKIFLRW